MEDFFGGKYRGLFGNTNIRLFH